jgi:hypothetical protein
MDPEGAETCVAPDFALVRSRSAPRAIVRDVTPIACCMEDKSSHLSAVVELVRISGSIFRFLDFFAFGFESSFRFFEFFLFDLALRFRRFIGDISVFDGGAFAFGGFSDMVEQIGHVSVLQG